MTLPVTILDNYGGASYVCSPFSTAMVPAGSSVISDVIDIVQDEFSVQVSDFSGLGTLSLTALVENSDPEANGEVPFGFENIFTDISANGTYTFTMPAGVYRRLKLTESSDLASATATLTLAANGKDRGEQGDPGDAGAAPDLRSYGGYLQWNDNGVWRNLVQWSTVVGNTTPPVALRSFEGVLQWKFITDTEWSDLASLLDLIDSSVIDSINAAITAAADNCALVVADIANINKVAPDLTNIDTVAGISADVTAVAESITNVNAVGANIADVTAVAGSITNVNAVGANIALIQSGFTAGPASESFYDNSTSGLDADNVQDAVDELVQSMLNVKNFGAIGDGVADDTAAIQAAIAAVPAFGGTIVFPNGEYKVTGTTTISEDQIWLKGDLNARIKRYGAFEIFNVTGSYNKISDLQLMGNKASYPYPANARAAIVVVQGDFNNIVDNQIEDGNSHGILFRTGGAPQFNLAQGNIILNCDEVGIAHDGGVDNRILGNHISGCGFEGVTLDQKSVRCIVDGNRLNANCQYGGVGSIGIDWTDLCVVSNNVITDSNYGLSGITFQNNLGPSNFNVIVGNVFDTDTNGVHMKTNTGGSCSDNVVSGNIFRTSSSIIIESGCQRNTLSGNVYAAFPDIHTNSYNRIDNALVNFYAKNTTTRTNVTGDGTAYVVPYNNLAQDRNTTSTGSYNTSTGVFTAPVTANYMFSGGVHLTSGTGNADTLVVEIVTSAGTFAQTYNTWDQVAYGASVTASFFLKRGETARVQATVLGGTKNYSVTNNANANFFTCVLVG